MFEADVIRCDLWKIWNLKKFRTNFVSPKGWWFCLEYILPFGAAISSTGLVSVCPRAQAQADGQGEVFFIGIIGAWL